MERELAQQRYMEMENRIPEFFQDLTDLQAEEFHHSFVVVIERETTNLPVNAVALVQVTVQYIEGFSFALNNHYHCYLDDSGKRMFKNSLTDREFENRIDQWLALF